MFENIDANEVKVIFFLALLSIIMLIESYKTRKIWLQERFLRIKTHFILSIINTVIINLSIRIPLMITLLYVNQFNYGLTNIIGISGITEILLSILIFDCIDYWWHRFNHRFAFLWRFHKVHHSDTFLDTTTALRFHVGELFLSSILKISYIIVWCPSLWGFILSEILITSFSQFHHANIDISKKTELLLRKFIITPFIHLAHHSYNDHSRNKNFSTTIIIWDKLFGTYYKPSTEDVSRIGIPEDDGKNIFSFKKLFLAPFK